LLGRIAKGWRYEQQLRRIAAALRPLTLPIIWLLLQWLALLVAGQAMLPRQLIKIVASLITAWVAIRLTATLVRDRTWSRFVAIAAWTIAALNILNLLEPASELLERISVPQTATELRAMERLYGYLFHWAGLEPGEYLVNESGKVVFKMEQNFPADLRAKPDPLAGQDTLKGPQANDDKNSYRIWQKTDTAGGPAGRYLVDNSGVPIYLTDPGINGIHKIRPDGSTVTTASQT